MAGGDHRSDESVAWVADSGFFIACGRRQNDKYAALERFARTNAITFVVPRHVYRELGGAPDRSTPGQTPIDGAIDAGWATVAEELDYRNGVVSSVMDTVRRYIAQSSNRNEDQIEKADTALAGVAVQLLTQEPVEIVSLVTTDTDAGEGVVTAVESHGFDDQIEYVNGFELLAEITSRRSTGP